MSVLVVGVDSTIGGALYNRLKADGVPVRASSRRKADGDIISLDLADLERTTLPVADAVVICAGVTSLQACRTSPEATRAINVDATLQLARRCAERGAFVVSLSTNLVFSGEAPRRLADDPPQPGTAYGQQKQSLEKGMAALGPLGCVVRLTKVIAPDTALLRNWRASLAKGEEITPYTDMVMAPVPLAAVVDALALLTSRRTGGLYQLSATNDVSYVDAAFALADMVGAPKHLVRPRAAPADILPAERPRFTSLDTARAQAELQWRTMMPVEALKATLA